jgi:flagellar biosynthesis/type III secretory pathway chaperone
MREQLNHIIVKETESLNKLLDLLDEQHRMLLTNEIYDLEDIVSKIQLCNKEIAEREMERRRITAGASMSEIVKGFNDNELETNYRKIKKLLEEVVLQKDTNEMLIKQGLGFSTRMLSIINPERNSKTYNSYGRVGKY